MGRIKSTAIKKAAKILVGKEAELTKDFDENKKILSGYTLPDKGTRNKISGYIVRLKRREAALKSKN